MSDFAKLADPYKVIATQQVRITTLEAENAELQASEDELCAKVEVFEGYISQLGDVMAEQAKEIERLTKAKRQAELDYESITSLPAFQAGYIDGRCDARSAIEKLSERFLKMNHLHSIIDALECAESEAQGEILQDYPAPPQ